LKIGGGVGGIDVVERPLPDRLSIHGVRRESGGDENGADGNAIANDGLIIRGRRAGVAVAEDK